MGLLQLLVVSIPIIAIVLFLVYRFKSSKNNDLGLDVTDPVSRKARMQFSMREIFLAMTAFCAILALIYTILSQSRETTPFFNSVEPLDELRALAIESGYTPLRASSSGDQSSDSSAAIRNVYISIDIPDGNRT